MKEFIDKLISRLEKLGWVYADYYPDETAIHRQRKKSVAYDEVVKIINQLAEEYKYCALCYLQSPCEYQNENAILPASELADNNGWIPCSERLPETEDYVLVCGTGNIEGVFIAYFEEKSEKWRYDTDEGIYYYVNVIAWQPLPAPYQPKE